MQDEDMIIQITKAHKVTKTCVILVTSLITHNNANKHPLTFQQMALMFEPCSSPDNAYSFNYKMCFRVNHKLYTIYNLYYNLTNEEQQNTCICMYHEITQDYKTNTRLGNLLGITSV